MEPPFRGAPFFRYPQGGRPILPRALCPDRAGASAGAPFGGAGAHPRSPGAPFGSRPVRSLGHISLTHPIRPPKPERIVPRGDDAHNPLLPVRLAPPPGGARRPFPRPRLPHSWGRRPLRVNRRRAEEKRSGCGVEVERDESGSYAFLKSLVIPSSFTRWAASRSSLLAWVRSVRLSPFETSRSLITRARLAMVVARRAIRTSGCFRCL